jgi:hypothetical protein
MKNIYEKKSDSNDYDTVTISSDDSTTTINFQYITSDIRNDIPMHKEKNNCKSYFECIYCLFNFRNKK